MCKSILPSPIGHGWVHTHKVWQPIGGLLNPVRYILPLISHICLYPPYHFYLHPSSRSLILNATIIAGPSVMPLFYIPLCQDHHLALSTVYAKFSIHQVQHMSSTAYANYSIHQVQRTLSTVFTEHSIHSGQHTPCTASTHDLMSSLCSHDYKFTSECSFRFQHASLQVPLSPASSPIKLKGQGTSLRSQGCKLTCRWIASQQPVHLHLTACKYFSFLSWYQPPLESPNSLHDGHEVHCQSHSSMVWECICMFTWS